MLTRYLPRSAVPVAKALMKREGLLNRKWAYDYGVVWLGMETLWQMTGDERYFRYIHDALDSMVHSDGTIEGYNREAFNLDYLCNGRLLISMAAHTGEAKYQKAAELLRSQLTDQPRNADGGFWHKQIYPHQMWLDGQHMAIPFYLAYEMTYGPDEAALTDAARQLILAWQHTLNPKTGLPCHGYDEAKAQIWADPVTGRSAHAWGRAVGWYMVALVDSLELLPSSHPLYPQVLDIFQTLSKRLLAIHQDGVWLQVLDCPEQEGNYPESSASCLIDYALLKGSRRSFLSYLQGVHAQKCFESIQRRFVGRMKNGELFIARCCQSAGLGGSSGRDGSFDYYVSESIVSRDLKATGAYLRAACEEQKFRTWDDT